MNLEQIDKNIIDLTTATGLVGWEKMKDKENYSINIIRYEKGKPSTREILTQLEVLFTSDFIQRIEIINKEYVRSVRLLITEEQLQTLDLKQQKQFYENISSRNPENSQIFQFIPKGAIVHFALDYDSCIHVYDDKTIKEEHREIYTFILIILMLANVEISSGSNRQDPRLNNYNQLMYQNGNAFSELANLVVDLNNAAAELGSGHAAVLELGLLGDVMADITLLPGSLFAHELQRTKQQCEDSNVSSEYLGTCGMSKDKFYLLYKKMWSLGQSAEQFRIIYFIDDTKDFLHNNLFSLNSTDGRNFTSFNIVPHNINLRTAQYDDSFKKIFSIGLLQGDAKVTEDFSSILNTEIRIFNRLDPEIRKLFTMRSWNITLTLHDIISEVVKVCRFLEKDDHINAFETLNNIIIKIASIRCMQEELCKLILEINKIIVIHIIKQEFFTCNKNFLNILQEACIEELDVILKGKTTLYLNQYNVYSIWDLAQALSCETNNFVEMMREENPSLECNQQKVEKLKQLITEYQLSSQQIADIGSNENLKELVETIVAAKNEKEVATQELTEEFIEEQQIEEIKEARKSKKSTYHDKSILEQSRVFIITSSKSKEDAPNIHERNTGSSNKKTRKK